MKDGDWRDLDIGGLRMRVEPGFLHVASERPLRVLSTAPVGGDLDEVRHFLNMSAPANLDCLDPEGPVLRLAAELGIDGPLIGFLTAVKPGNVAVRAATDGRRTVVVAVTVGVANATRPGEQRFDRLAPGTINTIVVIDGNLPTAALAETLALTAEAKALTLLEGGVRTPAGAPGSGTSTDAYAIACTGAGEPERYAGSVTAMGYLVGRAVRDAIGEGLAHALRRAEDARR